MKKGLLVFSLFGLLTIAGCSSNENNNSVENEESPTSNTGGESSEGSESSTTENNLFNPKDIEEGYWIGQSGNEVENEDMIITNPIDYNPESYYEMNDTAYVTYMSGDEILSTILHDGETPVPVEVNENADQIRISFDNSKLDHFELTEQ